MPADIEEEIAFATLDGAQRRIAKRQVIALSDRLTGDALLPTSAGFDEARAVWNGMIDVEPSVIARCESSGDVARAIAFAVDHKMVTSIRGGGHNVSGTALAENGLVIDLSSMNGVNVDPDERIARVQGGATLGDVDRATSREGLITPTGFISDTGIGGLTLRGGLGHTMRRFGLSCDNLREVELVTSSGNTVQITEESDPEALWALRGGPLELGVVTEFVFDLHPIPSEVRLIMSAFPAKSGVEVNAFMADYMREAPRELGLISFYVTLPEDEEIPEPVRGDEVIVLFGMYTGEPSESDPVLAPILEHDESLADLGGWMPYAEAQSALDEDYPDGMRYYWKSLNLDELTEDTLRAIHELGRDRPSPDSTLDVWTLGGAVAEFDPERSAFPQRDSRFMVAIEANWEDPGNDEANIEWARRTFDELQQYSTGGIYMNFAGSRDEHEEAIDVVYGAVLERLTEVQDRLDPAGLFA